MRRRPASRAPGRGQLVANTSSGNVRL